MDQGFWRHVLDDEDGAVTIDWVVLTAGLLIFGVMAANFIISGTTSTSTGVGGALTSATVPNIEF